LASVRPAHPRVLGAAAIDPFGPNDKSVRGGANEVERIASDQSKGFIFALIQYFDIGRTDDPGRYDAIAILAEQRAYRYDIVLPDIAQGPEKCVAVGGNSCVPRLSRQRSAWNMTSRAPEGERAHALDHHYGKSETWDIQDSNYTVVRGRR